MVVEGYKGDFGEKLLEGSCVQHTQQPPLKTSSASVSLIVRGVIRIRGYN